MVEAHLAQNAKNVENGTEALISRATQRLAQYRAGTLPAGIQTDWRCQRPLGGRRLGVHYPVRHPDETLLHLAAATACETARPVIGIGR